MEEQSENKETLTDTKEAHNDKASPTRGIVVAIIAFILVIVAGYYFTVGNKTSTLTNNETKSDNAVQEEEVTDMNDDTKSQSLIIEDLEIGTGNEAVNGSIISVHYTGTLTDGTKFDSSVDRGQPFSFTLGAGQVIQGWEKGFAGMKVGGKRKLTISPEMGYGSRTAGTIPPNSTLIFEVELLGVN